MKLRVDRACGLGRETGDTFELLLRRSEKPLGGAEVLQDRSAPNGTDAGKGAEDRLERARVATPAVMTDRKAVRFVTDPLQQLQAPVVRIEADRLAPAGDEDLPP